VVAQVLSYAGYLQGLDPGQLESQALAAHLPSAGSMLAAVQADDQQQVIDPAAFQDGLAHSLSEGGFRLVIVLDSAPDELTQVVGYLQSITDRIDIDLITVTAYDVAGSQVLVPQRIEPARRERELSNAQVSVRQSGILSPGSAEFRAAAAQAPPAQGDWLGRLADWADALETDGLVKLASFRGKTGITTLLPRLASDDAGLVSIALDLRSAYMQFWRSVFERRAPQSIRAVEAALGTKLKQGNSTRAITEPLLNALTHAYQEATDTTGHQT
jgi:hypothetical protein